MPGNEVLIGAVPADDAKYLECKVCGYKGEPQKIIGEFNGKIGSIYRCPKCHAEPSYFKPDITQVI